MNKQSKELSPLPISCQTKIVATLGPATANKESISALITAGVNMFRLNFSHGSHDDHRNTAALIHKCAAVQDVTIAILADLQGPKLRIGQFETGKITLKTDQRFRFDSTPADGDETRVCLPHPEIIKVLEEDSVIYLDDGNVRARIVKNGGDYIDTIIEAGEKLSNKKGLNVPGVIIPIPALTDKDKQDLEVALDLGVDWIGQSFVQTPDDVRDALALIDGRAALMAKLEKPAALDNLDKILDLVDGVMIARGDLGVEIAPEHVPSVQKRIINKCRALGKPVVVATQMLESMVDHARPTRAEASDVATAVYDGADAVMLSAETAVGKYPERAVTLMKRICHATESDETYAHAMRQAQADTVHDDVSDAIAAAAFNVAVDIDAKAIVTYTTSGSTAIRMARKRPNVPILCLTPDPSTARRLSLSYGVHAVFAENIKGNFSGPASTASRTLKKRGLAQNGDRFVMTAGVPFGVAGTTNFLRVAEVSE